MELSFVHENVVIGNNETIEIYMNHEIMEENVNVKIETSMNLENEIKEQMKINFKKLHAQKTVSNNMENYLCVGFFIVLVMMQKLTLKIHKSCIVSFVIKNL
jgi:hypothetical protein